ncbi:MAG: aminoglycoside phosphotransferase family protein [Clostridiales bacterium]|nr:aminoglycoside phosphotransferase family protein [Clostridiales bacterium]MDY5515309.1 aminoglycoside phosphotransferase family protein [Candidatus Ventricola sp.]
MDSKKLDIARRFDVPEGKISAEPYGNGHINDTLCVTVSAAQGQRRFIMQRVNRYVFQKPEEVIRNIEQVTEYLRGVIASEGGDPQRETLTLVRTKDGKTFTYDEDGELWRMYLFIEDTISRDLPDTTELFALSGEAFGRFQRQMGGFPAASLVESIPDFHNTPARYAQLMDAVARNAAGRLGEVEEELAFCRAREKDTHALLDALAAGEIPLRVTHNDTKLNNVLLDAKTGRGVCVIDLDTVMPGLAAYDFGDSIRFGANTAEEDERDLSKVQFSLPMYEAFTRGFLSEAGQVMSRREIELLPMGARLMTLECGMRFLADHLNGDKYFRIHRPGHNLDRARTQFALVRHMEENWDAMLDVVKRA